MSQGGDERISAILDHLSRHLSLNAELVGRAPGASHDSFVIENTDNRVLRYVARLQPGTGPFVDYDLGREARLLGELAARGIPVPTLIEADATGALNGTPYLVLSWIEGTVHTPAAVGRKLDLSERTQLAERLVEMLAHLHTLDWRALTGPGLPFDPVSATGVAHLFLRFDRILEDLVLVDAVVLDFVRVWLATRIPTTSEHVLVHGDFRLANLVWSGPAIVGVLDWETAHVGDPLFDLAWICMGALADDDLVMGLVSRADFVEMYRKATGRPVDAGALLWWQVAAAWVRGCTEARLLDLAATGLEASASLDVRDLLWEFGTTHTEVEMLNLIEQHDQRKTGGS